MKILSLLFLILLQFSLNAQTVVEENLAWRAEQNKEFRDTASSPLPKDAVAEFDSLHFFPIDTSYHVLASLELTPESKPFKMKTSTARLADYRQYGIATFSLNGKKFNLPVYQNLRLLKMPNYRDYLFIPFTDLTNGEETYAGGRYVEASIPAEGNQLVIDFNKSYNPYCAYSDRYSCPIPPSENHLETRVEAGTLTYDEAHH